MPKIKTSLGPVSGTIDSTGSSPVPFQALKASAKLHHEKLKIKFHFDQIGTIPDIEAKISKSVANFHPPKFKGNRNFHLLQEQHPVVARHITNSITAAIPKGISLSLESLLQGSIHIIN